MNKVVAGIVAFGAATLVSSVASAQAANVPAEGNFVFGAERMFGFYSYHGSMDGTDNNVPYTAKQSGTQLSLLWGENGVGGDGLGANPDAIPRIGFDYMLTDLISLGGSLGYYTSGGQNKIEPSVGAAVSADTPSINGFAVAPRVGFMVPITNGVAFWPRVGFSYYHFGTTTKDPPNPDHENNISLEQINGEFMFWLSPIEHFGFLVGPIVDLGVGGSIESKAGGLSVSNNASWTNYGVAAGLGGYF